MQKIKGLLKKFPFYSRVRNMHLYFSRTRRSFKYATGRFLKFSMTDKDGALAAITLAYHVIEKGLTMPDSRLGFGREMVLNLVAQLESFSKKYGNDEPQFLAAAAVVAEYKKVHDDAGFKLDEERSRAIASLLERVPVEPSQQIEMTRERYWAEIDSPFEKFSASRHSVRNFSGPVSVEQIRNSVALANNAPSACNRQYVKVHCVSDHEKIQACLALQNGNRGFGHLADKLLVLTANLRAVWTFEQNDVFTNAGIYLMNLSYALHKNRVAHCILNWSVSPQEDRKLRKILPPPLPRRSRDYCRSHRLWRCPREIYDSLFAEKICQRNICPPLS